LWGLSRQHTKNILLNIADGVFRGKYVVFKTVEENNVWAVGWSDIQFKTYICTQGDSIQKKGQRADGRNYRIEVDRPRVVED
jgi:hypothetical protein